MSRTTEMLYNSSNQLKPKHLDALHLINTFINEFEKYKPDGTTTTLDRHIKRMAGVYKSCKNYGF